MKRWLLVACLLFAPALVGAQVIVPSPTPSTLKLLWDHPGTNVDKFLLCVDALPCTDVPLTAVLTTETPQTAGWKVYGVAWPAMTPGTHSLVVKASFLGAEQASAALSASLVVVVAPTGLRAK